jgi:hypothetical protein
VSGNRALRAHEGCREDILLKVCPGGRETGSFCMDTLFAPVGRDFMRCFVKVETATF